MICFPDLTLSDISKIKEALLYSKMNYEEKAAKYLRGGSQDMGDLDYYNRIYLPTLNGFDGLKQKLSNYVITEIPFKTAIEFVPAVCDKIKQEMPNATNKELRDAVIDRLADHWSDYTIRQAFPPWIKRSTKAIIKKDSTARSKSKMTKICLNCRNTFSESDKACWNCLGMRFTRGVEYPRCKTCNAELYRYNSKNDNTLYTNTCVLRSHFYCNKHDPICKEDRKHPQKETQFVKVIARKKK